MSSVMPYEKRWMGYSDYELEAIVKCFLPDIEEFFATEEGKELREQHKSGKEQKAPPQANKAA